jgi:hypothetical protein
MFAEQTGFLSFKAHGRARHHRPMHRSASLVSMDALPSILGLKHDAIVWSRIAALATCTGAIKRSSISRRGHRGFRSSSATGKRVPSGAACTLLDQGPQKHVDRVRTFSALSTHLRRQRVCWPQTAGCIVARADARSPGPRGDCLHLRC